MNGLSDATGVGLAGRAGGSGCAKSIEDAARTSAETMPARRSGWGKALRTFALRDEKARGTLAERRERLGVQLEEPRRGEHVEGAWPRQVDLDRPHHARQFLAHHEETVGQKQRLAEFRRHKEIRPRLFLEEA